VYAILRRVKRLNLKTIPVAEGDPHSTWRRTVAYANSGESMLATEATHLLEYEPGESERHAPSLRRSSAPVGRPSCRHGRPRR